MTNKKKEFLSRHMDSTIWNDFEFRENDIIISSYAKSGTTWTQQIISQLLFSGEQHIIHNKSPWLEYRTPKKEEKLKNLAKQQHRRFIKTHLPTDSLVMSKKAKYIYLARDGRDVLFSLYNHHNKANGDWYEFLNSQDDNLGPKFTKPTSSIRDYFHTWLDNNGSPFWPYWENISSWWKIRDEQNVLLLHFSNLKKDPEHEIKRIADYLEITVPNELWPTILKHSSFEYMKEHAEDIVPGGGKYWVGGPQTFIHKGTNQRWKSALTKEDSQKYEAIAVRELGKDCAKWLEIGILN